MFPMLWVAWYNFTRVRWQWQLRFALHYTSLLVKLYYTTLSKLHYTTTLHCSAQLNFYTTLQHYTTGWSFATVFYNLSFVYMFFSTAELYQWFSYSFRYDIWLLIPVFNFCSLKRARAQFLGEMCFRHFSQKRRVLWVIWACTKKNG